MSTVAYTLRIVPIERIYRPTLPAAAAVANQHGIALRAQGRRNEALAALRDAVARFPDLAELRSNLALVLDESGETEAALRTYAQALAIAPELAAAEIGMAAILLRGARTGEAKERYLRVLGREPDNVPANLAMYEIEQIEGSPQSAIAFQARALAKQQVFTLAAPHERRRVLALLAPGDWLANTPVDFLFDRETTTLHKLYLVSPEQARLVVPPHADVVFNAIGESERCSEALNLASQLVARLGVPYVNDPQAVLRTNRMRLVECLNGIANCVTPPVARVEREDLERGCLPFAPPYLIRPVDSHAGHDLSKIDATGEIQGYLDRTRVPAYYVSPFVEYRRPDGYYRKYRVVCVDGIPYPYHLAISPNWMIHYYNAPMADNAWMRAEEERYLAGFESVFDAPLHRALRDVALAVGLEYVGIDCSIGVDGRLLVFEVDPAIIVHASDPAETYPYKRRYVTRIFKAVERMVDSRRARPL